jgi:signal transduction histidine kinase
MPLGLVVIFRAHQRAVAVGAVSCVLVAVAICAVDDAAPAIVALRLMQVLVASALAWVGSSAFAASARRERAAAERFAISELRRERAERTVYLVRLTTALAHELNNPLGFMRSNIELLLDDAKSDDEREALADSLGGISRISRVVAQLEEIAQQRPTPHPPALGERRVVVPLPRIPREA